MTSDASQRQDGVRHQVAAATAAFAAFGAFWGAWGACVPQVRDHAGITVGQLGIALLCIGAGALPAMLLTGPALDRWGLRIGSGFAGALGVTGAATVVLGTSFARLCACLLIVGAASGANDVAMNAVAGRAEQLAGRPVITRAHAVLSSFVVLGIAGSGLAAWAGLPLLAPFAVVAALAMTASALMAAALRGVSSGATAAADVAAANGTTGAAGAGTKALLGLGVLGALAFASEGAHQGWSAVFAHDVLGAGTALATVAPAVFATVVAITRFSISGVGAAHARTVLVVGAVGAAIGDAIVAAASTLAVATVGLAVAAAGTAVLFPTLLGMVSRSVDEARRGRATSLVTTISYLGFLLGPAYVGAWAQGVGLRGAMGAVAALGALLAVLLVSPAAPAEQRRR